MHLATESAAGSFESVLREVDAWLASQGIFLQDAWLTFAARQIPAQDAASVERASAFVFRHFLHADLQRTSRLVDGKFVLPSNENVLCQIEAAVDISHAYFAQLEKCREQLHQSGRLIADEEEAEAGDDAAGSNAGAIQKGVRKGAAAAGVGKSAQKFVSSTRPLFKYAVVDAHGRLFWLIWLRDCPQTATAGKGSAAIEEPLSVGCKIKVPKLDFEPSTQNSVAFVQHVIVLGGRKTWLDAAEEAPESVSIPSSGSSESRIELQKKIKLLEALLENNAK